MDLVKISKIVLLAGVIVAWIKLVEHAKNYIKLILLILYNVYVMLKIVKFAIRAIVLLVKVGIIFKAFINVDAMLNFVSAV